MHYISAYNPFFWCHVGLWGVAAYLFVRMHSTASDIARKAVSVRSLADSEYQRMVFPLEKYDQHFDLCSSMFIFVGLMGTIYGFYQAVPRLTDPTYDFSDLRDALATSGLGILWSVLLTSAVSLYQGRRLTPLMEKLKSRQVVDTLANELAGAMDKIMRHITGSLERSLGEFAHAAQTVGDAANRLSSAADQASKSFTAAGSKLNETADGVAVLLKRSAELPETVVHNLEKASEQMGAALRKGVTDQVTQLDATNKALAKSFEQAAARWQAADAEGVRQGRQQLQQYFDEFAKGHKAALAAAQATFGDAVSQTGKSIGGLAEKFAAALHEAETQLPSQAKTAVSQITKSLQDSALVLAKATESHTKQAEALGHAATAVERGLITLTSAAKAMAEGRSPDLENMAREMKSIRATLETQHKAGWWPFGR